MNIRERLKSSKAAEKARLARNDLRKADRAVSHSAIGRVGSAAADRAPTKEQMKRGVKTAGRSVKKGAEGIDASVEPRTNRDDDPWVMAEENTRMRGPVDADLSPVSGPEDMGFAVTGQPGEGPHADDLVGVGGSADPPDADSADDPMAVEAPWFKAGEDSDEGWF